MGSIYNIQRFSIHDGPGIRTVVFFKGCTLRCLWCHNPESISFQSEIEFYPERCIGCGRCFSACPQHAHTADGAGEHRIDRDLCAGCLLCAESCFAEALVGVGKEISAPELTKSILTDREYYETSGGGVTFSGGECMAQAGFLGEILASCKAHGIHTAADTAGNVPWASFEKTMDLIDLYLYDLKAADSALHERLTGAGNGQIVDNLRRLCAAGKRIFVRIPYIPGCNDGELPGIARILAGLPVERVELMAYHRLGEGKYAALGRGPAQCKIDVPGEAEIDSALSSLREAGINAAKA